MPRQILCMPAHVDPSPVHITDRKEGQRAVKGKGQTDSKRRVKIVSGWENWVAGGGDSRGRMTTKEKAEKSVYPWQLVDPIKADWLVNEAREARVLVPTSLLSSCSLTPLLQWKTIKKQMSKRCTFHVLIIPALCLSICYSLTSAVNRKRRIRKKAKELSWFAKVSVKF